ncbi:hypothetical protein ABZP36_007094 [Zizania latifolia]
MEFSEWEGDILAVAVTEKDVSKGTSSRFENAAELAELDGQLGGLLSEAEAEEDFAGKAGQSVSLRLRGHRFKRVCLIGLGQDAPSSAAACRSIGESIASAAKSAQATSAAIAFASPDGIQGDDFKLNAAAAVTSGILLGLNEDSRYKSESKKVHLKHVDLIGFGDQEVDRKLKHANDVSSGVIFGKELVNSPANVLTPGDGKVSKIASAYSDVFTATILDEERCRELKMGSYLAVAAASANPPHFIHLCYKPPGGNAKRKLAIVGKGLTFDSGGYNIKVGAVCTIELMKKDMGGSAAVFGAAKALGQIKPPGAEVHFIYAACENMISGTGMRPGDIVTASNGKTMEVNNTDAEGRLTLADALIYACKQGVDKIIDLATLTGACRVALGPSIAAAPCTQSTRFNHSCYSAFPAPSSSHQPSASLAVTPTLRPCRMPCAPHQEQRQPVHLCCSRASSARRDCAPASCHPRACAQRQLRAHAGPLRLAMSDNHRPASCPC